MNHSNDHRTIVTVIIGTIMVSEVMCSVSMVAIFKSSLSRYNYYGLCPRLIVTKIMAIVAIGKEVLVTVAVVIMVITYITKTRMSLDTLGIISLLWQWTCLLGPRFKYPSEFIYFGPNFI